MLKVSCVVQVVGMRRLLATPGRGAVPSPPGYIDMEGVKELVTTPTQPTEAAEASPSSSQKGAPKVTHN